jgi:cyclophilin family peptidyl-prolyl cis-trans isomerase
LSSDPTRPRPRSSKKRRAVQSGAAGAGRPNRPPTQRAKADPTRGGSASGGIPTAGWAIGAVVVFAIGVALAGGAIKFGSGASPSSSTDLNAGFNNGSGAPDGSADGASAGDASQAPPGSVAPRGVNCPTSEPPAATAGKTTVVTIKTAKGDIQITVDPTLGPKAAGNFIALASCGFYDGIVFHRVVPDFVIQGGDPTGTGGGGPGYEFADDPVTVPYTRGIVAMANSGPNTNGSQFFIVLKDTALNPLYSVFGRVTAGMDAVDAIAAAADAENPTNPIVMDKVTVGPATPASPAPSGAAPSSAAPSARPS